MCYKNSHHSQIQGGDWYVQDKPLSQRFGKAFLSRTINTNPHRVLLADRRSNYSGTLIHYGGWNSYGRNAKSLRKQLKRQVRRHVNDTLHLMELEGPNTELEITPKRESRRCVAWLLN